MADKPIHFRKAMVSDMAFLYQLRVQTMEEHLSKAGVNMNKAKHMARIQEAFDDSHIILFNDQPIGLIKLGLIDPYLHIRQFQIMPQAQNKGIGTQVLKVVLKQGKKLKRDITLNVLLHNPAKKLYEKQGFKVIGQNELEYQMKYSIA